MRHDTWEEALGVDRAWLIHEFVLRFLKDNEESELPAPVGPATDRVLREMYAVDGDEA